MPPPRPPRSVVIAPHLTPAQKMDFVLTLRRAPSTALPRRTWISLDKFVKVQLAPVATPKGDLGPNSIPGSRKPHHPVGGGSPLARSALLSDGRAGSRWYGTTFDYSGVRPLDGIVKFTPGRAPQRCWKTARIRNDGCVVGIVVQRVGGPDIELAPPSTFPTILAIVPGMGITIFTS